MRSLPFLLVSVVAAIGCVGTTPEEASSAESDLTGTGTCTVIHEDAEVVLLQSQEGKMMYAGKQLHVLDVRLTPPLANQSAGIAGSRFARGHVAYTIAPRVRPEALRRLGQLVGPGTPAAKTSVDPATATVETAILPADITTSAGPDGVANVELNDAPSTGASALLDAALRKQLVTGTKGNATITCGANAIPLPIHSKGNIVFDTTTVKVLDAATDLAAVETFLGAASAMRGESYKAPLGQVASADLDTKSAAFADLVDREIKPILQTYGASMTRAEMKTHLQTAYDAYRELGTSVRSATQDAALVRQLLPAEDALKTNVEKALADRGDGWVTKPLQ